MPDLPSVIAAAILADQLPQERILFGVVVSEFLSSGDFNLHQLPVFFGDDGRMGVLDVILGHFAFVLLGFMLKEINDESLLKKSVPLIFLVLKNGKYGVRSPSSLAGRCLDSFVIEFFGDAGKSRSRHKVKIDVSNDLGFLFVDFYFSIRSLFVTQERPVWHRNLSVGEFLPLPPSDVLGNGKPDAVLHVVVARIDKLTGLEILQLPQGAVERCKVPVQVQRRQAACLVGTPCPVTRNERGLGFKSRNGTRPRLFYHLVERHRTRL